MRHQASRDRESWALEFQSWSWRVQSWSRESRVVVSRGSRGSRGSRASTYEAETRVDKIWIYLWDKVLILK